jgi:hypothetical protein
MSGEDGTMTGVWRGIVGRVTSSFVEEDESVRARIGTRAATRMPKNARALWSGGRNWGW